MLKKLFAIIPIVFLFSCSYNDSYVRDTVYTSYDVIRGEVWKKKVISLQSVYRSVKLVSDVTAAITHSRLLGKIAGKIEKKSLKKAPKFIAYEYIIKTNDNKYKAVISVNDNFKKGDKVYVILSKMPELRYDVK